MVAKLKLKGIDGSPLAPPPEGKGGSNRWFDVLWAPTGRMDPPVFPWRIAFSSVPLTSAALVSDARQFYGREVRFDNALKL